MRIGIHARNAPVRMCPMLRNARVQRQSPTSELCLLGRNHIQKGSLLSGFPIQTSIDLFAKFSINELRLVPLNLPSILFPLQDTRL